MKICLVSRRHVSNVINMDTSMFTQNQSEREKVPQKVLSAEHFPLNLLIRLELN